MKDLKHMIYFEKLLDSACNDLVREAQKENRVAVGFTCFHIPEVLLNLDHCFSVRLRAPYMGSTEIATYYLASSACEFSRALLERAIEPYVCHNGNFPVRLQPGLQWITDFL